MKHLLALALVFSPLFAFAAPGDDVFTVQQLILDLLTSLGRLFWLAAVVFFVFGVVKFIKNADDSAEREKGKQFMVWAVIAFVVLVSLWGLVRFFGDTFGINLGGTLDRVNKDGMIL